MFSVKKVYKNEYAHLVSKAGRISIYTATPKGWAVMDENGIPICRLGKIAGEAMFDVFDRKSTAQKQADWMNQNSTDIELLPVEKYD